jgi:recombinational DNA repair protein (RecF pathway)
MPGQQLQTTGLVLGRQPSGSDSYEQLNVLCAEHGLLLCLRRIAKKANTAAAIPLDLFDEAELELESSNQGRTWFIREHRHLLRHPGLGRSYAALQAASALAALVLRNPVPEDSRGPILALLRQGLSALEQGARPDLVWLKALYCFLRDEGHPVKQLWWQQLPPVDRDAATRILNQPLAGQTEEPPVVAHLRHRLEDWARTETETRLA